MRETDFACDPLVVGRIDVPESGPSRPPENMWFKCYFFDRDGYGRSLTTLRAPDPASAVEVALAKFPRLRGRAVEVFLMDAAKK